jgi:hypothetical protein
MCSAVEQRLRGTAAFMHEDQDVVACEIELQRTNVEGTWSTSPVAARILAHRGGEFVQTLTNCG